MKIRKENESLGKSFYSLSFNFQKVSNFTQSIKQSIKSIYLFITFQNLEFWDITGKDCMYVNERVGDKPNETEREIQRKRKREEEVRSVRKMKTCNIHDSVYVEGEETTCLMRELEKHGREGKDLMG